MDYDLLKALPMSASEPSPTDVQVLEKYFPDPVCGPSFPWYRFLTLLVAFVLLTNPFSTNFMRGKVRDVFVFGIQVLLFGIVLGIVFYVTK